MSRFLIFVTSLVLVQQATALLRFTPRCARKYEEYKFCGSACPPTCNENEPRICTANCVAGCYCKRGYIRNTVDGSCCLPSECPVTQTCPLNEKYNECGSACPPTCNNKDSLQMCTDQCVVGCECNDGYVRNEADGSCCLPQECPAAQVCPLNEKYNECGSACPLTCKNKDSLQICTAQCVVGCECNDGYVRNEDGSCCLPEECPAAQVCPMNEQYNECGSACPLTCSNYQNETLICTKQCVIGCQCKAGYVRNEADGSCCLPQECPATQVCPLNEVYNICGSACPATCANYEEPIACTMQCVEGCFCKSGLVRDSNGKCVPTTLC